MPDIPGVSHRYEIVNGVRLHIAEAGDPNADPVLLLHGWPEHWYAWRKLIPPLAERYRVIAPDLRGFGWSDAPRGGYEKAQLAADAIALLDVLEIEQVRLAGHDWGGFAGFIACLEAPERISHYAAAGIPHLWAQPPQGIGETLDLARRLVYQVVIALPLVGKELIQRVPALTRKILELSSADFGAAWTPAELNEIVSQWAEPDRAKAVVGIYRSSLTKELPALARGLYADRVMQTPAILAIGEHDPVASIEKLAGFERNAPNLKLVPIAGAGHWIPEEAPDAFLAAMLELFER